MHSHQITELIQRPMTESPPPCAPFDANPVNDSMIHQCGLGKRKSWLIGIGCAGVLAVVMVVATFLQAGRSPAERAATSLAMPTAQIWLLFFAAAIASGLSRQRGWAMFFAALWLTVSILFNGPFANRYLRSMEFAMDGEAMDQIAEPLDAVVLLGGYAADNRFGKPELASDGQRLMLAAQLWHGGKTKTLLCTGTGAQGDRDPSLIGRELLVSIGVPQGVIFEVPGLNTSEEMKYLEQFFQTPPAPWLNLIEPDPRNADRDDRPPVIGLVTTAVHLSRAMRLAEQQGLRFIPIGCNFNGPAPGGFAVRDLIPNAGAGRTFAIAFKEHLARLLGR